MDTIDFETSQTLQSASFDRARDVIRIVFRNQAVYEYAPRPLQDPPDDMSLLFEDLALADSPGAFFQRKIRHLYYKRIETV